MQKTTQTTERRRYQRKEMASVLVCCYGQRSNLEFLSNLSTGGAGIETKEAFPIGAQLTLFLPTTPKIRLGGQVRWVEKKGILNRVGIQFNSIPAGRTTETGERPDRALEHRIGEWIVQGILRGHVHMERLKESMSRSLKKRATL